MRDDFTGGGVEFSIFLLIFAWALQQCSANALPVIVIIFIRIIITSAFVKRKINRAGVESFQFPRKSLP